MGRFPRMPGSIPKHSLLMQPKPSVPRVSAQRKDALEEPSAGSRELPKIVAGGSGLNRNANDRKINSPRGSKQNLKITDELINLNLMWTAGLSDGPNIDKAHDAVCF